VKVAILNNLKVADPKVGTPNDDEPEVEIIIPANPDVANPDVDDPDIGTLIVGTSNVDEPDVDDPIVEDLNSTSENTSDDQSVVFGDDIPPIDEDASEIDAADTASETDDPDEIDDTAK